MGSLTRDKLCSLIKKWQSTVEAACEVKTNDGYTVRMFCIGFTARQSEQVKTTCYGNATQMKKVRKKMRDVMIAESANCSLRDLVKKFIPESISPMKDVYIRKCKVLKKPKFDITKLMELHEKSQEGDVGAAMARPEEDAAVNTLTADVKATEE